MGETDWLADRFEASRIHLRAVAYRMLGSYAEADDAIQEAWLRLRRADPSDVENLSGWLTTVVGRVCLDRLRSRRARPEQPVGAGLPEPVVGVGDEFDPEHQALIADSVGSALLVVLDLLAPAERVAFVLHDIFAVPFGDIGHIIGRSPEATRQVASRARRRVQGAPAASSHDLTRRRVIADAFLAASRDGNFGALVSLLDPEVMFQADDAASRLGAPAETHGAAAVATLFAGRAQGARPGFVNGAPALVWAPEERPRGVFVFTIVNEMVAAINMIADRERIGQLDIVLLDDPAISRDL
jgi:RNA polymerase sigma factor (sigma-70 family)